jgi:hypothetical protein
MSSHEILIDFPRFHDALLNVLFPVGVKDPLHNLVISTPKLLQNCQPDAHEL